jgi:hypothetical protein
MTKRAGIGRPERRARFVQFTLPINDQAAASEWISRDVATRIKFAFVNYGVSPRLVWRPAPRACFSRHVGPGPRI